MRVQVYFNLRKKCFSIRGKESRRVIAHAATVVLENCVFKVSQAGRHRVLATGRKNVHAWVEGDLLDYYDDQGAWPGYMPVRSQMRQASYNPHKVPWFVDAETHKPVLKATDAVLWGKLVFYQEVV